MDETKQKPGNSYTYSGLEIAVIGMAGRFPAAKNIDEFWKNLITGQESIVYFSDEELKKSGLSDQLLHDPLFIRAYGWMEGIEYFDASFFGYTPLEAETMDPQIRIFHECVLEALENTGYDPHTYKRPIGLYAGASANLRWQGHAEFSGKNEIFGWFAAKQLNDKDFLSTRIAHRLNLKGPAVTLDTACSTSLVAIHMACRGLICGDCDMALSGGVTIGLMNKNGYQYQEGMIHSPDGHCRAFDARAKGSNFGNASAVVVLKRINDAIADRDTIYAVIKGSAINNDGTRKAGFTAPSVEGQVEVIRTSLKMAEVNPESIGYIETHGTGTTLGDPVEIESLKAAFNTNKKHFCRIGSVKTNLGHLEMAAGVTGFIKAVLALKHRLIPPSLFFENPNPGIDFENSPFYVNTELTQWQRDGGPLKAAVSSFGIGGTNAHAILEEAPPMDVSPPSPDYQIILFSAKTESGLEQMTENLTGYFKKNLLNPGLTLADAAYTLQVGRRAFKYRRMAVCSNDVHEIIDLLSPASKSRKVKTYRCQEDNPPIVFMFPGLGAQYVNMGRELYEKERLFRQEMDHCFEILNPLTGYDLKEILYPSVMHNRSDMSDMSDMSDITHFEIAQPVIFIFEYALAKLLIQWGIKPHAMIGYSFGEYTAACVSGVLALKDALKLVAARARLIQKMPRGTMLSVPLPVNQVEPLINDEMSISIDNGPSCIVSGPNQVIETFERQMREKKIVCMQVPGSRAIHSKMTTPILKEFQEVLDTIPVNKPQIPYISNVTGDWLTNEEAVNPAYWSQQLRQTVRFDQGMKRLVKKFNAIYVEVGPGRDISALTARYFQNNTSGKNPVINLVRHPHQTISDVYFLLKKIGILWLYGQPIDWLKFYEKEKRHRVPLPTYPFEKQRYSLDVNLFPVPGKDSTRQSLPLKRADITDWFYVPSWKRSIPPQQVEWNRIDPMIWLVFIDSCGLGIRLVNQLQNNGQVVISVKTGPHFSKINTCEYTVNPAEDNHYETLFIELQKDGNIPAKIIHLWNVTGTGKKQDIRYVNQLQNPGYYSLINIARSAGKLDIRDKFRVIVVTDNMQEVIGEDQLYPLKSTILGPVKVIPKEYANITLQSLDIILPKPGSGQEEKLIEDLLNECMSASPDPITAFRDHHRWVEVVDAVPLKRPQGKVLCLRPGGVYLITGGLGGIGLALARYLAREVSAQLVLIGRSKLPPRDRWNQWLLTSKDDDTNRKIRSVLELEKSGANVLVASADVSKPGQMQTVIQQASQQLGPINGIIHAAGLADGTLIQLRTRETSEKILAAKLRGTLVLDAIFKDESLDFFILCSSIDSLITSAAQVGYCAANNFMNAFAKTRAHRGASLTISINWPRWQGVGIAVIAENLHKNMKREVLPGGISIEEGVDTFCRILSQPMPQVAVFDRDLGAAIKNNYVSGTRALIEDFETANLSRDTYPRPNLDSEYIGPGNPVEETLAYIWQQLFGFEEIGIQDDFFELGGDSLRAVIVIAKIHKELNAEIPIGEFFNHPTIKDLAEYINRTETRGYSTIQPVEKKEYYPLASAQKRFYILQEIELESTLFNNPLAVKLENKIVKEKLEESLKKMINRHESLRTSFEHIADEPVQKIHKDIDFTIEYFESSAGETAPITAAFSRPFDLGSAPLFRVGIIKLEEEKHILMLDMHHLITDLSSMTIFIREAVAFYQGNEFPPLRLQYKDFCQWQQDKLLSGKLKQEEEYLLKQFSGDLPVLNMPTDYPRPSIQSFAGDAIYFHFEYQLTRELNILTRKTGTTLYIMLLALYNVLLTKYTSQKDIIVGSPTAGRYHADLENIIGLLIETLVTRNYPEGEKTFTQFLEDVRKNTLTAYENQGYPLGELLNQIGGPINRSRNPLFDAMLIVQNIDRGPEEQESRQLEVVPYIGGADKVSKVDLTLEATEERDRIAFRLEYCTKLFKKETMESFIISFKEIASAVVENKDIKLKDIKLSHDLATAANIYKAIKNKIEF